MPFQALIERQGVVVMLAIAAGADLVILDGPEQVPAVLDRLERALAEGELFWSQVQAGVERVLRLKNADPCLLVAWNTRALGT